MVHVADPLMIELCNKLPAPGTYWPLDERMAWLQACESVFNLIYGREPQAIFIDASKVDPSDIERLRSQAGHGMVMEIEQPAPKPSPPEPPKVDPPKEELPRKNLGGAPSKSNRPANLPTNLEMALAAIDAIGPSSAPAIRKYVRDNYWAETPDHWTACLWDHVSAGKLARDGINFIRLPPKPTVPEAVKTIVEEKPAPQVLPKTVVKTPMPAVKPTAGPRPGQRAAAPVKFDHGELTTYLPTMRHYVIAGKLRVAMGKGHVSEAFLAENTIGSNTENNRMLVKDLCLGMNEPLAIVGLKIEHYPGFGLIMKDMG